MLCLTGFELYSRWVSLNFTLDLQPYDLEVNSYPDCWLRILFLKFLLLISIFLNFYCL